MVDRYMHRALSHPRGEPDQIVLTVEKIGSRPRRITSLPLCTAGTTTVRQAQNFSRELLRRLRISEGAIDNAFDLLCRTTSMRGAALLDAATGSRLEPDRERGIRVSRLGLGRTAAAELTHQLELLSLNTETVQEALVLASKVASCMPVVAELCISDDPDYTTGYLASRLFGYLRVPHLKKKKARTGGRVFFLDRGTAADKVIAYLERTPVLINTIAACSGSFSTDEILAHHNL